MGRNSHTEFAIVFGIAIPKPKIPAHTKKKARMDVKDENAKGDDDDSLAEDEKDNSAHEKKQEKKDIIEEEAAGAEEEEEEKEDDDNDDVDDDDYSNDDDEDVYDHDFKKQKQVFYEAHERVFGANAETGLSLEVFEGLDERFDDDGETIYIVEYKSSRVHHESFQSGGARVVSLLNLVAPPAQVSNDIIKLLKDGFDIEPECEPGYVAIATNYFEE